MLTLRHHDYTQAGENRLEAMIGYLAHECGRWAEGQGETAEALESLPVCSELGIDAAGVRAIIGESERIVELANVFC